MIRRKVNLPPGVALTDVWGHLNPEQRRIMLRAVQGEAEAVRREAAAYRAGHRQVWTLTPAEIAEQYAAEQEAAAARQLELGRVAAEYRVGDALARPAPVHPGRCVSPLAETSSPTA